VYVPLAAKKLTTKSTKSTKGTRRSVFIYLWLNGRLIFGAETELASKVTQ
jgi:hypothetical protein